MVEIMFVFLAVIPVIAAEIKIEAVTEQRPFANQLYWDSEVQALYYTDLFTPTAHKYVPSTNTHTSVKLADEGHVCSFVPRKAGKNKFLTTLETKILIVEWDGVSDSLKHVEEVYDEGVKGNSWAEGAENENGNFWIGSYKKVTTTRFFNQGKGNLYSINSARQVTKQLENTTTTTAIVWSIDNKLMYYVDPSTFKVEVFDFDADANAISNRRTFFDIRDLNITQYVQSGPAVPNSLAMDTDGNLWMSVINGGCILKLHPNTAKVLQKVDIPSVPLVESIAFGGPNMDELYITSASAFLDDDLKKKYPDSGKVLRVTGLGVKGIPALPSTV